MNDDAQPLRTIQTWTKPSFKIVIHPVDACSILSASLAQFYVWDWQRTQNLTKLLADRPPVTVVDIGAHIGYVSLLAAALGHRVVAFEPMALNLRCFRASLALQPELAARITLEPMAISDRRERLAIHSQVDNIGNGELGVASGPESSRVPREEVTTERLDAYFAREEREALARGDFAAPSRPADETLFIVKIDVESLEPAVIAGAEDLLAAGRIRHLFIECSPRWARASGHDPQAMFDRLAAAGFTMCDEATGVPMTAEEFAARAADPATGQFELFASRAPHELFPGLAQTA